MRLFSILALCGLLFQNGFANTVLFQTGNPGALLSGATEGDMCFQELHAKGNFGLGTFNGIQGEMIALEGKFYKIEQQGKTTAVQPEWKTPWVQLVNFSPKSFDQVNDVSQLVVLKDRLHTQFPNKNIPYAVMVKGHFSFLKMRSRTPRKALDTSIPREDIYEAKNVSGTLAGFWFPEYLLNIGVPGFHFHFLSEDKKLSGHVLDLSASHLEYAFLPVTTISLHFPGTEVWKKVSVRAPDMETYRKAQM